MAAIVNARRRSVDHPGLAGLPAPPVYQPRLIVEIRDDAPAPEVGLVGLAPAVVFGTVTTDSVLL
eukprot:178610-Pyramimonas_sp.AAC.1